MIIATCGHEINGEWAFSPDAFVAIKDWDRDGSRCISYKTVCQACRIMYESDNDIAFNDADEMDWFSEK